MAAAVWICALLISLCLETCRAQKSMMYLKGKHGRRFASEEDHGLKQGAQGWYTLLKGVQKLQSLEFGKPGHILSSEKLLIHYLRER